MTSGLFSELERKLDLLSADEQLLLVERLVQGLRKKSRLGFRDKDLIAMAQDPEIQGEIQQIDTEFAEAESDGL